MKNSRRFWIKRGDTSPALLFEMDPPVPTAGATARFSMRRVDGPVVIDRVLAGFAATASPTLRYPWRPQDTAAVGVFAAEFEVTNADGTVETWPNDGMIDVVIGEDIR